METKNEQLEAVEEEVFESDLEEDDIDLEETKKIALIAYNALDSKQGEEIKIIDIHMHSVLADYFIICNGRNPNHVRALMDEVEDKLAEAGYEPKNREGINSFTWALLDYSHVIVHIFSEEARDYYNLDKIWQDGKQISPAELEA